MGCPIKIGAIGIDPYVMTENYTQNDRRDSYKLTGLAVEILKFVCEKVKLTAISIPPTLNVELYSYVKTLGELDEGLSDVVTGVIFLIPIVVSSSFDTTIPYKQLNANMFLPCPKVIRGTEKVLTTFSLSVCLTMGVVLLLTAAVFWCAGNGPYRSVCNETHISVTVPMFLQYLGCVFGSVCCTAAQNF